MIFKRIKTSKSEIIINVDNKEEKILIDSLCLDSITLNIVQTAIATAFKKEITEVFIHINRDKTIAIATKKKPDVWPEDVKENF